MRTHPRPRCALLVATALSCANGSGLPGAPPDAGRSSPPAHCSDGHLDGDETDLDCGGSCAGCDQWDACRRGSDCASGHCLAGHCVPPPTSTPRTLDFTPPADLLLPGSAANIVVADMNGDHTLDVVVCTGLVRTTGPEVFPGRGDGTFGPPRYWPTHNADQSDSAHLVKVGDLNADGRMDIVVIGSSTIATLLGAGDGAFSPALRSAAASHDPAELADFDGDGVLDLALTTLDRLLFWRGAGNGTFVDALSYPADGYGDHLIAVDVDGDGRLDLTMTADGVQKRVVQVWRQVPGFAFVTSPLSPALADYTDYRMVDLDADGAVDFLGVALRLSPRGTVDVALGRGDGTFAAVRSLALGSDQYAVEAADFNGDGLVDAVVCDGSGEKLQFLPADQAASLVIGTSYTLQFCSGPMVVADLDRDGRPDLVFAHGPSAKVGVMMNRSR